jgi:hypothetical protein
MHPGCSPSVTGMNYAVMKRTILLLIGEVRRLREGHAFKDEMAKLIESSLAKAVSSPGSTDIETGAQELANKILALIASWG